jgi:two-component system sensor histidine kinase KdpD
VALLTWLLYALLRHTHPSNLSLIYLAFVLVLAVIAGSGPAIVAALLAFFALDWYFVPPVGHLVATGLDGWLALFLFLVVAVLTGQLTAGFRNRAAVADRRAQELAALYELSVAILGDAQLDHVLHAIVERLSEALGARSATLWLVEPSGQLTLAAACDALEHDAPAAQQEAARRALDVATRRPAQQPGRTHQTVPESGAPITLGARALGMLMVSPELKDGLSVAEHDRILHAFAGQAALAIERARLAGEEERARQAAASERMKSILLASVSHDLRTPLTAIRTAAAGLREALGDRLTPPLHELTQSIDAEAARLNRLVENLLEMSRIEAEGLPPKKAPEDLAEIIGTVVHRLRPLLEARRLVLRLPDNLPAVPLDAVQIDRVLSNLFENAVKFSPAASTVQLDVWLEEDEVRLRLSNDGAVLSEQDRLHLFDKFYRREATAGVTDGTGLGLAICKAIVEAHGGRIWAQNDGNRVSITFSLPVSSAQADAVPYAVGAAR